jgi:hypothetical protein
MESIAMSIGSPLRIFIGSEQAQLASGQDMKTWNRRLSRRQNRYLTPRVVRPLIDRLIMIGCLPYPKQYDLDTGRMVYHIYWPDIAMPNEDEMSQIADRRSAALLKFTQSGAGETIQLADFLHYWLGFDALETANIIKGAKAKSEVPLSAPQPTFGAPSSGVAGKPPSKANPKPRPGGKKQ